MNFWTLYMFIFALRSWERVICRHLPCKESRSGVGHLFSFLLSRWLSITGCPLRYMLWLSTVGRKISWIVGSMHD
ncbi:hypothetical protein QBC37DRAFT_408555 [Rhypophila decipiens]|uniref:Uncharacterized protein n=1 Tax=Rhypophila decipiens TaxID=261697 RepID=A0AAN7BDY0_9PEZI|nr:hypothetical protein QBC37DRAFT_408555 [Rhypophila decipiens]